MLKILIWTIAVLVGLLLLVIGLILFPPVQEKITGYAVDFLEEKIGTEVQLHRVFIGFPTDVVIEGLYVEDQQADTLAYLQKLKVNIDMLAILDNKIIIESAYIEGLTSHIHRSAPDSVFNFMFIPEAFASDEPKPEKEAADSTESKGFTFDVQHVELVNLQGSFIDETSGLDLDWVLGNLEIDLDQLDLETLTFDVDDLELSDSKVNLVQNIAPVESEDEDTSSTNLGITVNSIVLNNVDFNFQQKYAGTELIVEIGNFELEPSDFDLVSTTINIEELLLEDSYGAWIQHKIPGDGTTSDETNEEMTDPLATFPWTINAEELKINNQSFDLLDHNTPETPGQFNAQHMKLSEVNVDLKDLSLDAQKSSVDLEHVSLREESGVRIDEFQSYVYVDSTSAELRDFLLLTPNSRVELELTSEFASVLNIIQNPQELHADLQLNESSIDFRDLLPFVPDLKEQLPILEEQGLRVGIDVDVNGQLSDLDVRHLIADVNEATRIELNGQIKGLPDVKNSWLDLELTEFTTNNTEIKKILPPNTLPETIQLPSNIHLAGTFEGSMENFDTDLLLETSSGDVDLLAAIQTGADSIPHYQAQVHIRDFDLGYVLSQDSLGIVRLEMELDGKNFDPEKAEAELEGIINSIEYGHRTYEEIPIYATIDNSEMEAEISLEDSLIHFDLEACAEFDLERPYYRAQLNLDGIDLMGMGLTSDDFRASGKVTIEAVGDSINEIDLHVDATEVLFIREGDRYPMDSLGLSFHTAADYNRLDINSGLIDGFFESNIPLDQMEAVMMQHVDKYYNVLDSNDTLMVNEDHFFEFDFTVKSTDVLSEVLLPDLHRLSPGRLNGKFNQSENLLDVEVVFPAIEYGGLHVDSLDINIQSVNDSLIYKVILEEIGTEEYYLTNTSLYGSFTDQVLKVSLAVLDSLENQNLLLSGNFRSEDGRYRFSFEPDGVVFDEEVWDTPEDHYLEFGKEGMLANNLQLKNGQREITLESRENELNAPMDLTFNRFDLEELSQAVDGEENLVSGEINGTVALTFPDSLLQFDADLKINDLHFQEHALGNLELQAQNSADAIDVEATLTGDGNDVHITGQYQLEPEINVTLELDMRKLELASIEPFTKAYIDSLSGYLSGDVSLSGDPQNPQFSGNIQFNSVGMQVPMLGTYYKLNKESFSVNNEGLKLNNFTITDEAGKTASFNGSVLTNDFLVFRFNLDANINRFQILDKPDSRDAIFFGNVLLDSKIKVRGNTNKPIIQGSAEIVKGSKMSLVIPDREAQIENSGGIDEFIVRHQTGSDIMTRTAERDTTVSALRGMDLSANLKLNRESEFYIYLSEARDNYVRTQGNAELRFGIDPSGKINMTGRYELVDGEYQLIYRGVVRKKFDIEEGSSIVWMGNPLTARLDLTALHTVETDALGLLEDQLAGSNQADMNRFRQKMPFWLQLHLGGELTEPDISFNIDLPPDHRGVFNGQVDAKLSMLNQPENESERNKQVFALLVLGRFLPGDPLSGGGSTEAAVRNNMSRLLSRQLSKLTEEHIQGVELDMELDSYEDYSSGQAEGRTELNLGVSKNFLDERLTVRVGGSIDLEGDQRRKQQASDFIGDLSVEYQLTENGFWRTRGFRKNTYEGIIDGEIIETGISLIFSRSYNKIHEIFQKPEENQESDYPEDSPESEEKDE